MLPLYEKVCATLIGALSECAEVMAIAVGGSHGRGESTEDSDLDLFVLVRESNIDRVEALATSSIREVCEISVDVFRGPVPGMGIMHHFLTADFRIVDLCLIPYDTHRQWNIQPTMNILWERRDSLSELCASGVSFDNVTPEQRVQMIQHHSARFLIYISAAAKYIRRRNLWTAIYETERSRSHLFSLVRVTVQDYPPFMHKPEQRMHGNTSTILDEVDYRISADFETIKATLLSLLECFEGVGTAYLDVARELRKSIGDITHEPPTHR